jgi:hypothetical protein
MTAVLAPGLRERPGAARRWLARPWLQVLGLVTLMDVASFWGWFSGRRIPAYDFAEIYVPLSYQWWNHGGLLHPPSWVAETWNGYPVAATIQNAAWYLPVGLANAVHPFEPHTAAVVAALHVAFGSVGAYVLARRLGVSHLAALLVCVAYFFSPGFFDGAGALDMLYGWALVPWLALICTPLWPWRRWWAVPVASLLVWQALMGVYPGIIGVGAYALGAGFIASIWGLTPHDRWMAVRRLAVVAVIAALLSAIKYVPALALELIPASPDLMSADFANAASVFFPWTQLPVSGHPFMVSFFIPTGAVVCALLAGGSTARRVPLTIGIVAALVGLPFLPTYDWVHALPLLDVGRFRMMEAKPFLVLGVVLLAGLGCDRLLAGVVGRARAVFASGFVLVVATGLGLRYRPAAFWWAEGLVVAASGLVLLAAVGPRIATRRSAIVAVLGTCVAGGLAINIASQAIWNMPRLPAERTFFGASVDSLIADGAVRPAPPTRPARQVPRALGGAMSPGAAYGAILLNPFGTRGFFDGEYYVGGFTNFKRNPFAMQQFRAVSQTPDLLPFFLAPQSGAPIAFNRLLDTSPQCLEHGSCGPVVTKPISYAPGHMSYSVASDARRRIAFNESYYPGWKAQVCSAFHHVCTEVAVTSGPGRSLTVQVPRGYSIVKLDYAEPRHRLSRWLFWSGAVMLLGVSITTWRRRRLGS